MDALVIENVVAGYGSGQRLITHRQIRENILHHWTEWGRKVDLD
jgi:hypothetical protein